MWLLRVIRRGRRLRRVLQRHVVPWLLRLLHNGILLLLLWRQLLLLLLVGVRHGFLRRRVLC